MDFVSFWATAWSHCMKPLHGATAKSQHMKPLHETRQSSLQNGIFLLLFATDCLSFNMEPKGVKCLWLPGGLKLIKLPVQSTLFHLQLNISWCAIVCETPWCCPGAQYTIAKEIPMQMFANQWQFLLQKECQGFGLLWLSEIGCIPMGPMTPFLRVVKALSPWYNTTLQMWLCIL